MSAAPMRTRLAEERATLRALGFWRSAGFLVHRMLERMSGARLRLISYVLAVQPVPADAASVQPRASRITVRELEAQDHGLTALPRPAAVMAARFARNGRCVGAFDEGRFAGMLWFHLGPYDEDEVRCAYRCVPDGRVSWDYDMLIDEAYRLSPLFSRLWACGNAVLARHGIEWTASRISAYNAASLRSHARLGARSAGIVTFLCLGSVQLMIGSCAPYVHLSLRRGRPVITVDARRTEPIR